MQGLPTSGTSIFPAKSHFKQVLFLSSSRRKFLTQHSQRATKSNGWPTREKPSGEAPAPAPGGAASRDASTAASVKWPGLPAPHMRRDYGELVSQLNPLKLAGEAGLVESGPHVRVIHLSYFKPLADVFQFCLRAKDRQSAKQWAYVNAKVLGWRLGFLQ